MKKTISALAGGAVMLAILYFGWSAGDTEILPRLADMTPVKRAATLLAYLYAVEAAGVVMLVGVYRTVLGREADI